MPILNLIRWSASCAVLVLVVAGGSHTVAAQDPAEIIRAVVARSQAVTSGRVRYVYSSENWSKQRAVPPIEFAEVTTSFSESSWADRTKGTELVRINHNGCFLEFVNTPQPSGGSRPGAVLHPARTLAARRELNVPPIFAGSLWHREQVAYLSRHAQDFRQVGTDVIDGVHVIVLEHDVPAQEHRRAFHMLLPALRDGGVIRLRVAPQLGFVVPKLDFVSPKEEIAQSYQATGFHEMATGIFLPTNLLAETYPVAGASRYRGKYRCTFELVNQEVPEEDFVVQLPEGTNVQDARVPGNVIKFKLISERESSQIVAASDGGTSSHFFSRWGNAMMVGAGIGLIASVSYLISSRNQRFVE